MASATKNTLKQFIAGRMQSWLSVRIPAASTIRLDHRSIFIFPSLAGGFFLVLLAILLLAAINYQNSMLYAFTFLLGSIFAVSIIHSYRNLAGLSVALASTEGCFPGEAAMFHVHLGQRPGRTSEALELRWQGQAQGEIVPTVDSVGWSGTLGCQAQRRGLLRPGRLLVQSVYPLGLVRTWTWLDLQAQAPVYPKPVAAPASSTQPVEAAEGETQLVRGSEDYQGLRQYSPGDSFKHVAWKQFAQKGELYTKDFAGHQGLSAWLDFADYPGLDVERRLSALAERVLVLSGAQQRFGLRLPGEEVVLGSGRAHQEQCLKALAFYDVEADARLQRGNI